MNRSGKSFHRVASTALIGSAAAQPVFAQDVPLVEPKVVIVDATLPQAQVVAQELAARRYDTFWATGDETLARAALAPDFVDRTLPPGRLQGVAGSLAAFKAFHAARTGTSRTTSPS